MSQLRSKERKIRTVLSSRADGFSTTEITENLKEGVIKRAVLRSLLFLENQGFLLRKG